MALVDADRADKLYALMGAGDRGVRRLGRQHRGRRRLVRWEPPSFIGKVRDDGLGKIFGHPTCGPAVSRFDVTPGRPRGSADGADR